jgi:hypothetical protein
MPRGGVRLGAGRPKGENPPKSKVGVSLSKDEINFLKSLGDGSISSGVRVAIKNCRNEIGAPKTKELNSPESNVLEDPKEKKFFISDDLFLFVKHFLPDDLKRDIHWKVSSVLVYSVFESRRHKIKSWPGGPMCMSYQATRNLIAKFEHSERLSDLFSSLRPRTSQYVYLEIEELRERFANDAKRISDLIDESHNRAIDEMMRKNAEKESQLDLEWKTQQSNTKF